MEKFSNHRTAITMILPSSFGFGKISRSKHFNPPFLSRKNTEEAKQMLNNAKKAKPGVESKILNR